MVDFEQDKQSSKARAGKEYRMNTDRFFHVMGQGWYVLTREGTSGPYLTKELAREFILELVKSMVPEEKKESWRYNPV
ncbi:MAG: hypothetical protein OEY52_10730 [Gammaproteobacteria bacterium]|nr:hypothetical protein [Gammaproteobacteria bacterium]